MARWIDAPDDKGAAAAVAAAVWVSSATHLLAHDGLHEGGHQVAQLWGRIGARRRRRRRGLQQRLADGAAAVWQTRSGSVLGLLGTLLTGRLSSAMQMLNIPPCCSTLLQRDCEAATAGAEQNATRVPHPGSAWKRASCASRKLKVAWSTPDRARAASCGGAPDCGSSSDIARRTMRPCSTGRDTGLSHGVRATAHRVIQQTWSSGAALECVVLQVLMTAE